MAAGISDAFSFEDPDWSLVGLGYVVMRVALVAQWLRAARDDPPHRSMCLRYAVGIIILQIGWVLMLLFSPAELFLVLFAVLAVGELLLPLIAGIGHEYP